MLSNSLSENIVLLRKSKRLTQFDLAKRLHVTRQTLSTYERGIIEPNIGILCNLADIFDVSVDDLIGRNINH